MIPEFLNWANPFKKREFKEAPKETPKEAPKYNIAESTRDHINKKAAAAIAEGKNPDSVCGCYSPDHFFVPKEYEGCVEISQVYIMHRGHHKSNFMYTDNRLFIQKILHIALEVKLMRSGENLIVPREWLIKHLSLAPDWEDTLEHSRPHRFNPCTEYSMLTREYVPRRSVMVCLSCNWCDPAAARRNDPQSVAEALDKILDDEKRDLEEKRRDDEVRLNLGKKILADCPHNYSSKKEEEQDNDSIGIKGEV